MRHAILVILMLVGACDNPAAPSGGNSATDDSSTAPRTLAEARRGFNTKLLRREAEREPAPMPPSAIFQTVKYPSPAGELVAYVSASPKDGKKHPAIIWLVGGFSNSVSSVAWEDADPDNDQSASAFRQAGIIMMYPSLRGGNDNPGFKEGFFGEVDDVLAAAEFLAKGEYVDANRIYLGGHSTGGTLALLVAESSDRFRAVFSFGPAESTSGYGGENVPYDVDDPRETEMRAPIAWLGGIRSPTFVFEGTERPGNFAALTALSEASTNAQVRFHPVKGANHFSILAPITRLVAIKILRDQEPATNLAFDENELARAMAK